MSSREKKLLKIEDVRAICDKHDIYTDILKMKNIPEKLLVIQKCINLKGKTSERIARLYLGELENRANKELIVPSVGNSDASPVISPNLLSSNGSAVPPVVETNLPSAIDSGLLPVNDRDLSPGNGSSLPSVDTNLPSNSNSGSPAVIDHDLPSDNDSVLPPVIAPEDITTENIKGTKPGILMTTEDLKEYNTIKESSIQQAEKIDELSKTAEELKMKIKELIENDSSTIVKKRNDFSMEFQNLTDILNSTEKVPVQINRELLSKCTKYLDDNSLIKLENLVRQGWDLYSIIVQSILLTFLKQNTLDKLQ